ncbi:uncharacterized protein TNCV_1542771 [Trichonephila clavipes]|nr:uncharacterized protein TNCV_1542771 [Trichonephila clavipes]
MAPGSHCMNGNTCGCRMSWIYRWAIMVSRINTRGDHVLYAMAPHTITEAVEAVCLCKANAGLRRSPRGPHTRTRLSSLLRLNPDSSLKTTSFHSAADQFPHARHHTKRRRRCVDVKGSTRKRRRDHKCPSDRRFLTVREDRGTLTEGATSAWMAADEAVGCTRAFLPCGGLLGDWYIESVLSLVFV